MHNQRSGRVRYSDLQVKNTSLPSKWLFKLLTEDGVWQTLQKTKYVGSKALSKVFWIPSNSHFLYGLMAMKKNFEDGLQIFFWEDKWLGNTT
jgi:hypothetical protein